MTTKVQKWGNSLALRIPKSFIKDARLKQGTEVNMSVSRGRIVIESVPEPKYSLDGMLARVTKANRHSETDTGRPLGREVW